MATKEKFIPRQVEKALRRLAKGFPALVITGPRQSGKTTLAQTLFSDRPYTSFEDPDALRAAQDDPRRFLEKYRDGVVVDEAQRFPELFSYLQRVLDDSPECGRFVLTGSQHFSLLSHITQSLAGRVAIVELLPLSYSEIYTGNRKPTSLEHVIHTGMYPAVHSRKVTPADWYSNYMNTYIERDVRNIMNVRDLQSFQRFMGLCAGRAGQLLNLSQLAADTGVTHNTARAWISVLEASYIIFLLQPHHRNFNKRLIRMPKLYFHDTGLAAYLLAIRSSDILHTHPLRGALFENWIIAELMKTFCNRGQRPQFYFWRERSGRSEVDLLVEHEQTGRLMPVEIKAGQTLNSDFFKGLDTWRALAGKEAAPLSWLVYGGDETRRIRDIRVTGWKNLKALEKEI